jgi:hypothetical protein
VPHEFPSQHHAQGYERKTRQNLPLQLLALLLHQPLRTVGVSGFMASEGFLLRYLTVS